MRLSLWFVDGKIAGSGADMVGKFTFDGTYDLKTGRCLMTKHYVNAHRLIYDGANQDDGMWLWGLWRFGHDRGGFHLWPEGEEDPTQRRTSVEREEPVDAGRKEVLVAP